MATGDVLVSCVRCGIVRVLEDLSEEGWKQVRALPAGAELDFELPCRACDDPRTFRVLCGPLHVPRPESLITALDEIAQGIESRARAHACTGYHCSTCDPAGTAEEIQRAIRGEVRP